MRRQSDAGWRILAIDTFCGEEHFRHAFPIDPSFLSRWRKRIGKEGAELILKLTATVGLASEAVELGEGYR